MSKNATLEINGEKYEFPIIEGTENELAIDIKTVARSNWWCYNH